MEIAEPRSHSRRWMRVGSNEKPAPARVHAAALGRAEPQLAVDELTLDDVDRPAGDVVVMPAGVVARPPEDGPDVDVGVAMKRGVHALVRTPVDAPLPQLGTSGDRGRQPFELGAGEDAVDTQPGQTEVARQAGTGRSGQGGHAQLRGRDTTRG